MLLVNPLPLKVTTVTNSAKFAAKQTSVAACWVPEDVDAGRKNKRIVVYFISDDQYLYAANCVLADSTAFTQPVEKPSQVGSGYSVRPFSQLSIYRDKENKRNIVWATNPIGEITPMYHEWSELGN